MVYYALADAIMVYGLGGYGLTFKTYLDKVKTLQIRLLKLLVDTKTKNKFSEDYEKLFKICNILPITEKVIITVLMEQIDNTEFKKRQEHAYPTRLSKTKKCQVPKMRNYYGKRTRRWVVPVLMNELPPEIYEVNSKKRIKKILTKHYLSLCP